MAVHVLLTLIINFMYKMPFTMFRVQLYRTGEEARSDGAAETNLLLMQLDHMATNFIFSDMRITSCMHEL